MNCPGSLSLDVTSLFLKFLLRLQSNGTAGNSSFQRLANAADLEMTAEECSQMNAILQRRAEFAHSSRTIAVQDYGTGISSPPGNGRSVRSIHSGSSIPHRWGVFLFRIVRTLAPRNVLELGTNLGVSGAYLRSALDMNGGEGLLVTMEGDPSLAAIAEKTIQSVSHGETVVLTGRFQDRLPAALERLGSVNMAFLDGHHEYDATLRYFEMIRPHLAPDACVVFDDVYLWSRPVRRAWKHLVFGNPSAIAVDLAKLGMLLFQKGDTP